MATPWSVPRGLWKGRTVLILASGPSLTQALPTARRAVADGRAVAVAVNSTGVPVPRSDGTLQPAAAPWAAMLYGADAGWWRHHAQHALKFPGLKVTIGDSCEFKAVLALRNTGVDGFDPDPSCLRTGGSSAHQAAHLAAHAGAARILLCGVDCHTRNGSHHHGDHPIGLRNPCAASLGTWIDRWEILGRELAKRGIEVINCSAGSAVRCFPQRSIEEVLCES